MVARSIRSKKNVETAETAAPEKRVRKTREARELEKNKMLGTSKLSSSKLQYAVKLFSRAPVAYSGQLLSIDGDVLEVRTRRRSSSKIDRVFINKRDVVSIVGEVGKEAIVNVMEDHVMIAQYVGTVKNTDFGYEISTADSKITVPFEAPVSVKLISEEPTPKKVTNVKKRSSARAKAA